MTKLYVGMRRGASRRLLLAQRHGRSITYEFCWEGKVADLEELACALLVQHWGDGHRAQSVSVRFARLMHVRLSADFWTLRPSEIDDAITRLA